MEIEPFLRHQERLVASREAAMSARRAAYHEAATRIAAELEALGASRVWLFGSLVRGALHDASDIDLAVSGLALASDQLLEVAERCTSFQVDIVPYERVSPAFQARIAQEGVILVDRTGAAQR